MVRGGGQSLCDMDGEMNAAGRREEHGMSASRRISFELGKKGALSVRKS